MYEALNAGGTWAAVVVALIIAVSDHKKTTKAQRAASEEQVRAAAKRARLVTARLVKPDYQGVRILVENLTSEPIYRVRMRMSRATKPDKARVDDLAIVAAHDVAHHSFHWVGDGRIEGPRDTDEFVGAVRGEFEFDLDGRRWRRSLGDLHQDPRQIESGEEISPQMERLSEYGLKANPDLDPEEGS